MITECKLWFPEEIVIRNRCYNISYILKFEGFYLFRSLYSIVYSLFDL